MTSLNLEIILVIKQAPPQEKGGNAVKKPISGPITAKELEPLTHTDTPPVFRESLANAFRRQFEIINKCAETNVDNPAILVDLTGILCRVAEVSRSL